MNRSIEIMKKWAARKRQFVIILTIFMVMFTILIVVGIPYDATFILSLAMILILAMNMFINMSDLSMLNAVTSLMSGLYAENNMLRKAVYTLRTGKFIMYRITPDDVRSTLNKDMDDDMAMKIASLASTKMADELSGNEWFMEKLGELIKEEYLKLDHDTDDEESK